MLLVSWFSQPAKSFSSYYLYEPRTRQFCRIRLELGRNTANATDGNKTMISFESGRSVGFSETELPDGSDDWSVNGQLQLCYQGAPLKGPPPKSGAGIYDAPASLGQVKDLHLGNPVTSDPKLPPDIQPKHLALLAQEAMLGKEEVTLTEGNATPQQLAGAIKARVATVLEKQDFGEVTDDLICAKLTEQARGIAANPARTNLKLTLAGAQEAADMISAQLTSGTITAVVAEMRSALEDAVAASRKFNARETLNQITTAQQAQQVVGAALKSVSADTSADTEPTEVADTELSEAEDTDITEVAGALNSVLNQAAADAMNWQATETDYAPLITAGTADQYIRILSDGT